MKSSNTWLPEEVVILDKLVGNYPSNKFVPLFRKKASTRLGDRYINRTDNSIIKKASAIAGSIKPVMKNMNFVALAETLGIHSNRIYRWKNQGYIKFNKNGRHCVITKNQLIDFAKAHPRLLAGIDEVNLLQLYTKEMVAWIKTHKPHNTERVEVVHVPSKTVYSSINTAAKEHDINLSTIIHHLKNNSGEWMKLEDYKASKNMWHGRKVYTIYRLHKKKKKLRVDVFETITPPNGTIKSVFILDRGKQFRQWRESKLYYFAYDMDSINQKITEIKNINSFS